MLVNYSSLLLFMDQRRLRQTVSAAIKFEPHVVVTVDAKGFSFRVLRSLTGNGYFNFKIHWEVFFMYYIVDILKFLRKKGY